MSKEPKALSKREQIEAMLPWYESGQLDDADAKAVADYLADHPGVADQLALIEEERGETTLLNQARGTPSARALDRLMDSIEAHEAANPSLASTKKAVWGWASRLVGAPVPASLQWVAAAAAILIVAQGVSLGVLLTSGSPFSSGSDKPAGQSYETASGPSRAVVREQGPGVVKGTFALVQFTDTATVSEINAILTEKGFTVVDGPKPRGFYKVRISDQALDNKARDTILDELMTRQELVSLALPAE